jgi:hypothetical protein
VAKPTPKQAVFDPNIGIAYDEIRTLLAHKIKPDKISYYRSWRNLGDNDRQLWSEAWILTMEYLSQCELSFKASRSIAIRMVKNSLEHRDSIVMSTVVKRVKNVPDLLDPSFPGYGVLAIRLLNDAAEKLP